MSNRYFRFIFLLAIACAQPCLAIHYLIADGDAAALKQAVASANNSTTHDTIMLWLKGTYTVPLPANYTGVPNLLEINKAAGSLVIQGNGATLERDLSDPAARLLAVTNSTLTIHNLYLRNGNTNSAGEGAAVVNTNSALRLYNCAIANCQADNGGAIYASAGSTTLLYSCTITQCTADLVGSALYFGQSCNATISNCTISGNLTNSSTGAALHYVESSLNAFTIQVYNSILANNKTNDGTVNDIYGAITSGGRNLVGAVLDTRTQTDFFPTGNPNSFRQDYVGTTSSPKDPQLNPFTLYGGLTPGMTLTLANATARDQARNASSPVYDQAGNNRVGNADIGSMEYTEDADRFFPFYPKMSVLASGQLIPAQGSYTFASQTVSTSTYITVKIKDKIRSSANLYLLSTPLLFLEGTDAGEFQLVTDTLRKELSMADSSGFQVYFNPQSSGTKTAMIRIASNDLSQPVFEFTVQGTATDPLSTGLERSKEKMLVCYPNPVNEELNLVLSESTVEEITVTDVLGHVRHLSVISSGETSRLDCSTLPEGLYTLRIREKEGVQATTFLISR
ncbi:MAG: polymorphic outer membrane protein [Cytophagaceae bacterium]|nr:polymorphic outer membrane protein [Cytophagaceae bacterium]